MYKRCHWQSWIPWSNNPCPVACLSKPGCIVRGLDEVAQPHHVVAQECELEARAGIGLNLHIYMYAFIPLFISELRSSWVSVINGPNLVFTASMSRDQHAHSCVQNSAMDVFLSPHAAGVF